MTYEEKKAWLSRYGTAIPKENYLREAQSDTGRTTQQLSGMPSGSSDGQALLRMIEQVESARQAQERQGGVGCPAQYVDKRRRANYH